MHDSIVETIKLYMRPNIDLKIKQLVLMIYTQITGKLFDINTGHLNIVLSKEEFFLKN